MRHRSTGFGLPELIIAIGLAAALSAGVAKLLAVANKSGKSVTARADFASLADTVAVGLKDPATCHLNLKNSVAAVAKFSPTAAITAANRLTEIRVGANSIAKKDTAFGNLMVTDLNLTEADPTKRTTTATEMKTLGQVTLRAQVIGNPDKTFERTYFINVTTNLVSGATQHDVTFCALQMATNPITGTNPGGYTVLAVHSQTFTTPSCPTDWEELWTGYSFAGTQQTSIDLGLSGSCLETFNPMPFISCDNWGMICDYITHSEVSMWLSSITVDESPVTGLAAARARIGRCAVCGKATPVLVRHNLNPPSTPPTTTPAPAAQACPTGWSTLWTGYSFGGVSTNNYPPVDHLHSPGSCLPVFKPSPMVECNNGGLGAGHCDFFSLSDVGVWLTGYYQQDWGVNDINGTNVENMVSHCRVCAKD